MSEIALQTKLGAPLRWLRQLYEWVLSLAESRHAVWALVVIAFCEASFFRFRLM